MATITEENLVRDSGMYPQALQYGSRRPPCDNEDLQAYGKALQDAFMKGMREALTVTGEAYPVFWVLTKKDLYRFLPKYGTPEEKDRVYEALRVFSREVGAWATISTADTWMVALDEGNAEHLRSAPLSQHPDGVDALMGLLTFTSGEKRMLLQPYWKEHGVLIWGEMYERSQGVTSPAAEQPPTG